jgi:hypothetical protein
MRYLAAAALVLAVACDSSTSPEATIVGTWNLSTMNGSPLPFTVFGSGANKVEITAGVITFAQGGTYSSTMTTRSTMNGVATNSTDSETGNYTITGATVSITDPGEPTQTATMSGNTLTTTVEGFTFVFIKQ